ncbi:hypothetical protein L3V64_013390 [Geobacillus stearothermophilus]|uniref:hypothetical protein n=1 Tax=Geobacillus stearothermophilus TaxID=1422 RepID=UPI001F3E9A12|nr:hypothetical protein [Geobacillus stearothermophilus]MCK7607293.1 hypothetical protein [Geobacillus stearothermophilus]
MRINARILLQESKNQVSDDRYIIENVCARRSAYSSVLGGQVAKAAGAVFQHDIKEEGGSSVEKNKKRYCIFVFEVIY